MDQFHRLSHMDYMKSVKVLLYSWQYKQACMLSRFSRVWLFANPWTAALPGSSVHGSLQAKILEWVAISSSRECSWPRIKLGSPVLRGVFFTLWPTAEALTIYILLYYVCITSLWHISLLCVLVCLPVCVYVSMCIHPHMCLSAFKPLYGVVMEERCVSWGNSSSNFLWVFPITFPNEHCPGFENPNVCHDRYTSVSRKYFFKRYILFISSYNSRFLHVHLALNITCFVLVNFGISDLIHRQAILLAWELLGLRECISSLSKVTLLRGTKVTPHA